ncbi:MAG: hypothetical protein K8S54_07945 [Spirochaetia bacterium]|nr:hypothetical protein [Spirochaetia bacterium]
MLAITEKELSSLGTRPVFNRTLRHMVNVTGLVDQVEKGSNLADVLNKQLDEETLGREQLGPILSLVLVSRLGLPYRSKNLEESVNKFDAILSTFQKWTGVDLVIAYHHPNLGTIPINPANEAHWSLAFELKRDELIVVYASAKSKNQETAQKALDAFFELLAGKTPAEIPDFIGKAVPKPAAQAPAPQQVSAAPAGAPIQPRAMPAMEVRQMPGAPSSAPTPASAQAQAPASAPAPAPAPGPAGKPAGGARNLTPKYSVQVTNELFHNGNVEAWKNIIESYETAHPGCKVIVYHEGELIQDLNSLFKWGKVKHGGLIMFQVAGNAIKNVSRLQKYLHEGASKRYESFTKHDLNRTLNLF